VVAYGGHITNRENRRRKLKNLLAAVAMTVIMAAAVMAEATPVTVQLQLDVTSVYDYPSQSYIAFQPISGILSFTFDIDQRSITDYGTTTITKFGGNMGTTWSSPVTSFLPLDPYSGAYGGFYNSYTFPNVSDYSSTFIEEAASQANTYQIVNNQYSYYHIEVRATRHSPPQTADGASDYAFTRQGLLDFYRSFQESSEPVYFNESYAVYTLDNGATLYSDGKSWSTYDARVINVIDHAAAVPEPSTALLLAVGGLPLLVSTLSRRRNRGGARALVQ
jgi:hypothetical protein